MECVLSQYASITVTLTVIVQMHIMIVKYAVRKIQQPIVNQQQRGVSKVR